MIARTLWEEMSDDDLPRQGVPSVTPCNEFALLHPKRSIFTFIKTCVQRHQYIDYVANRFKFQWYSHAPKSNKNVKLVILSNPGRPMNHAIIMGAALNSPQKDFKKLYKCYQHADTIVRITTFVSWLMRSCAAPSASSSVSD